MDYGLLMRRVMAQLALTPNGGTVNLDPVRAGAGHPSKLLTAPEVIREHCQKCQREPVKIAKRWLCPSCGIEAEIVYASPYKLQAWWDSAYSLERKRAVVRLALGLLRTARIRQRQKLDMGTREGRLELGRLVLAGEVSVAEAMRTYGYQRRRIYQLRELAQKEAEARLEDALAWRHYGPLEHRVRPGIRPDTTSAMNREKVDETL